MPDGLIVLPGDEIVAVTLAQARQPEDGADTVLLVDAEATDLQGLACHAHRSSLADHAAVEISAARDPSLPAARTASAIAEV